MKYYLLIIISVFFVLVLSFVFFTMYKNLYLQSLQLRLDPLEEKQIREEFYHKILAIGSSSIRRWPLEDIKIANDIIFNAGIDGQTSTQVLLRLERRLLKDKPQYLIIQVGLNDIKSIELLEGYQTIENIYISNVKRIIELCLENKIVPVYVTNFPTGRLGILRSLVWNKKLDGLILKTNNEIKQFCLKNNVHVFDAYEILVQENSLKRKSEYSEDFFHINKEGYKLLNSKLESELQKIII